MNGQAYLVFDDALLARRAFWTGGAEGNRVSMLEQESGPHSRLTAQSTVHCSQACSSLRQQPGLQDATENRV